MRYKDESSLECFVFWVVFNVFVSKRECKEEWKVLSNNIVILSEDMILYTKREL